MQITSNQAHELLTKRSPQNLIRKIEALVATLLIMTTVLFSPSLFAAGPLPELTIIKTNGAEGGG